LLSTIAHKQHQSLVIVQLVCMQEEAADRLTVMQEAPEHGKQKCQLWGQQELAAMEFSPVPQVA